MRFYATIILRHNQLWTLKTLSYVNQNELYETAFIGYTFLIAPYLAVFSAGFFYMFSIIGTIAIRRWFLKRKDDILPLAAKEFS